MIARLRSTPGGWALSGALAAVFLGAVDLTVISTVLPKIVFDLQINTADIDRYIWVVNAYLLAYIVAIPLVGRLSDVMGRRAAFQAALALFLAGSVWSGFADTLPQLIAGRALQGAGGGALLPVTMALVGDLLPAGRRVTTLGLVGAIDTLGWVLGPLWGAAVVGIFGQFHDSWRWVFWVNVPLGIVVAVVIHRTTGSLSTGTLHDRSVRQLDVPGALLLGVALLLLNLGLSSGGETGVRSGSALRALGGTRNPLAEYLPLLLVSGAVVLIAFVVWQAKARFPLLPPRLFRDRVFLAAMLANFVVGASLIAAMVDVPITVALLVEESRISTVSAFLLAPFTLLMALTSFLGGRAARSSGERSVAIGGLVSVAVGYGALWVGLRNEQYLGMIPGLVLAGAGFGLVVAPIGATAIDHAAESDRGAAAGLTILFRLLGMTIGISALTAFGISRLQGLSAGVDPILRGDDETTAEFFVRQNQFIQDVAIPLTVRVIRESFLIAAALAILAILPVKALKRPSVIQSQREAQQPPG